MPYFVIPALLAIIYIFIVRPKIKQYRAVSGIIEKADAAGASIWGKFLARLSGFKTVILGSLAAMMPQLPPIMDEINGFTGSSGLRNTILSGHHANRGPSTRDPFRARVYRHDLGEQGVPRRGLFRRAEAARPL
jgi:hypothetical protein